jgi:DNA-binding transcriptional ArsR family regulator
VVLAIRITELLVPRCHRVFEWAFDFKVASTPARVSLPFACLPTTFFPLVGMSRYAVRRALARLEEAGMITVTRKLGTMPTVTIRV